LAQSLLQLTARIIFGGEVLQKICQHLLDLKSEHDFATYTLISLFMAITVMSALSNLAS
jgi:hypothetical protein